MEPELQDESYLLAAMPQRVAMARRALRPLSLVLGKAALPAAEEFVLGMMPMLLREADTACRLGDGGFGLLLEDTPESGAVWAVERVRRLAAEQGIDVILWAGVATYPAHALSADDLLDAARRALAAARQWPASRTEVATPTL
jgi:pyruvate/2-oxoglutarate dehydrogenase complex dihydrolipoamide acyltransferase (E2) component